jgi:hypothetical protein
MFYFVIFIIIVILTISLIKRKPMLIPIKYDNATKKGITFRRNIFSDW